jgi:large subunit ribosomal protein L18
MAKLSLFDRRRRRVRTALKARSGGRPRLSVHRSGRHIYAQIIDDTTGQTLVAASTMGRETREGLKKTGTIEAAKVVGLAIGRKALSRDIAKVVFDRNGHPYHGQMKALAEAAREAGLQF